MSVPGQPERDSSAPHGPDDTNVNVTLYTGSADPGAVTAAIGVAPTQVVRQGEVVAISPARQGFWSLSSEEQVKELDPETHLRWVLDALEPGAEALAALRAEYPDWRAFLSIYWSQEVVRAGFVLASETVARVAALGLDLRVGIVIWATDDAAEEEETYARFDLGEWALSSREAVDDDAMGPHVAWLAAEAEPLLDTLRATTPGEAQFTCIWARSVDNAAIRIPTEVLARVAALTVRLGFDIAIASD
jgi:hypothetical protein